MLEIHASYPDHSDEELLQHYRDTGSLDVLGELYARYMHLVYGVALKYLGQREDAHDMSMQIFEKLITDVREHEIRTFKSWLYVLTKNQCLMQLRSRKSQHSREEGYKIEQEFMESESEVHPLDREDRSLEDALNDCIAQLKAEQKACITLFYYEKLCYQEIAEKMVIPEKKVKSYLQNGKRNLKICLEEKHHVRQKSP